MTQLLSWGRDSFPTKKLIKYLLNKWIKELIEIGMQDLGPRSDFQLNSQ